MRRERRCSGAGSPAGREEGERGCAARRTRAWTAMGSRSRPEVAHGCGSGQFQQSAGSVTKRVSNGSVSGQLWVSSDGWWIGVGAVGGAVRGMQAGGLWLGVLGVVWVG